MILDSSGSTGNIASYQWTQVTNVRAQAAAVDNGGTDITLIDADKAKASFSTRPLNVADVLTFQLTVTDNNGNTATDKMDVTISPVDLSAEECVALGGECWNNWTKTAAGGSGSLPTPETNQDYARCKACHGWDQLGIDGGYVRRTRKETRPNAGYQETLPLPSRDISSGGYTEENILQTGTGRSWDQGTGSWDGGSPEGFREGNKHPDYSVGDNLPTDKQIECLLAFLNDPGARADQVFKNIDPASDPVVYTLIDSADASAGETFYNNNCLVCHGTPDDPSGGSAGGPEGGLQAFLGKDGKPSEFASKVSWGEPGTTMIRATMGNPTPEDVADLIKYIDGYEPLNPCDPDPCATIANAQAGTCTDEGGNKFSCDCDVDYVWDSASNSCKEVPPVGPTYDGEIKPIIDANCLLCHAPPPALNLSPLLTTYAEVAAKAADGTLGPAVSCDPPPSECMGNWLTTAEAALILEWIADGYPEN